MTKEQSTKSVAGDDRPIPELFSRRWKKRIVIAAVFALILKLGLAWFSPGTQDVITWEQFVTDDRGLGGVAVYHKPYTSSSFFNHPPFMLHFVGALGWITDVTGLPVRFCLRLAPSIADVGSAFVLWKIFQNRSLSKNGEKNSGSAIASFSPQSLLLFIGVPAMIGISGFHGNTDPIMMFFVLLSVLLLEQKQPVWIVGLAFGMSLNIKVASLVFLFYLPNWRQRIEYSMAVVAAFFCGGLPYLIQDPIFILHRVFGYGGSYGAWGISRLLQLEPELGVAIVYQHFGKELLLGALILFSLWMNGSLRPQNIKKPDLLRQLALLILLFFTLTPAFGAQYLAWAMPLMLALEMPAVVVFYGTASLYLLLNYFLIWNHYPVEAWPPPPLTRILISTEIICWLSVVVLFLGETRRLARDNRLPQLAESGVSAA